MRMCLLYSRTMYRLCLIKLVCVVSCWTRSESEIDCIGVFEELGSHGWTSNIAHHSLVLMLRGLHREWKQPVAFYLIRRRNKDETLVVFLMEVLVASRTNTHCSEVKNYYLHGDSRITIVITDKVFKTSD